MQSKLAMEHGREYSITRPIDAIYSGILFAVKRMNKRTITEWITFAANILVALPFAVLLALIFFSFLQFHSLRLDWIVYCLTATLLLYIWGEYQYSILIGKDSGLPRSIGRSLLILAGCGILVCLFWWLCDFVYRVG